jgi:hypothetical protein
MTLQSFPGSGGCYIPKPEQLTTAAPGFGTTGTIDASAEKWAYVFQAPTAGVIDKVEFRLGAVTLGGSSVFRVSLQTVDTTTGNPDGSQDQYRDMTSLTANAWNVPGLMTSDGTDTGTKRTVSRGEILAVVFEYQTFTAADSVVVSAMSTGNVTESMMNLPYCALFTASWSKVHMLPLFALKYNDGAYRFPVGTMPGSALNTTAFASNSTPDERGLLFQVPFPVQLEGIFLRGDIDNDADVVLYDSGSSALATVSLDSSIRSSANGQWFNYIFSSVVDLDADTDYRLALKPTTTSNATLYDWDAGVSLANFIGGSTWKYTTRTDAGAWTDTSDKRPWMGLILGGFDDGAGGGGGGGSQRVIGG